MTIETLTKEKKEKSSYVLVHYNEIGIKGKNRFKFIDLLIDRIRKSLDIYGNINVKKKTGRILVKYDSTISWNKIEKSLSTCFGIAYFARTYKSIIDLPKVKEKITDLISQKKIQSFKVRTRKSFKNIPVSTKEWDKEIGSFVQAERHLPVDMKQDNFTIHIEVIPNEAYIYFEKFLGPGGLPQGISGHMTCLLSGGIDSPVASWRMMKRGCEIIFVHFHGSPFLSRASAEKALDLVEILNQYQINSKVYLVPFGELQKQIVLSTRPEHRVILYRRFMLRIAELISNKEKVSSLVTGESLGQVASQTLTNISTIQNAVEMPILRPLIGMDKEEIIKQAKEINTFEISIEPDQDCCTLFVPKHPSVSSKLFVIKNIEKKLPIDEMIKKVLEKVEIYILEKGQKKTKIQQKESD